MKPQIEQVQSLASQAAQQLQVDLLGLSLLKQNRVIQQIATADDWQTWKLGGFCFADGSVLIQTNTGWQSLRGEEARAKIERGVSQPLEVHLHYSYVRSFRQKRSLAEARFELEANTQHWWLSVEYEPFMDSPLYGLRVQRCADLLELDLLSLYLDTPQPSQRWRLEQIALYPDWVEVLHLSRVAC